MRPSGVPARHSSTPSDRNASARKIIAAAAPAFRAKRTSTVAPTSTNSVTSAQIHSLPSFSARRLDTNAAVLTRSAQAMLTTASSPETGTRPLSQVSAATSRNDTPRMTMVFVLLRT